jgi:glycosyltransferase involved in cell wall biosynthesis
MMRIVQVIDSLTIGGTQKMMIHLTGKLRFLGIDVTVVGLRHPVADSIMHDLDAMGVRVFIFPFPKLISLLSLRSFIKLLVFLRKEKFDLIQANLAHSNVVAGFAGWLLRTPVIGSLRNAGDDPLTYSSKRELLDTFSLKYFCRRILANGYAVADFARKRLGNTKIDVIPNAVAPILPISDEARGKLRMDIAGSLERTIIFSAGRFDSRKGFSVLIQAFAQIHDRFPDTILVLAGDGYLRQDLQVLIDKLGIHENVVLLGFRNDVHALLASVDIYVNSSLAEGMAVSILEAMSIGLAVIATSVGDTPYVVQPGTGILVPPNQSEEIAFALEHLLKFRGERYSMGLSARRRILNDFNLDVWVQRFLALYAEITPKAEVYLSKLAVCDQRDLKTLGGNS